MTVARLLPLTRETQERNATGGGSLAASQFQGPTVCSWAWGTVCTEFHMFSLCPSGFSGFLSHPKNMPVGGLETPKLPKVSVCVHGALWCHMVDLHSVQSVFPWSGLEWLLKMSEWINNDNNNLSFSDTLWRKGWQHVSIFSPAHPPCKNRFFEYTFFYKPTHTIIVIT